MKTDFNWQRRSAFRGSLIINGYVALADWVLLPLHAAGYAQPVLAYMDSLAWIAEFPGYLCIHRTGIREALSEIHRVSTVAWLVMWVINLILWTVALRLLFGILFPRTTKPVEPVEPQSAEVPPPVLTTRRRFLTMTARTAVGGFALAGAYSVLLETRWFEVTRRRHVLQGLRSELNGLRIVQLTDIHHGPALSLNYVRQVVEATNALDADLILLTGDYVHRSAAYIEPVVRELALLRAKIGVVGVLGNHDWWEGAPLMRSNFALAGIPLVDNDRLFITPDRRIRRISDAGLCIAGVGDYLEDTIRLRPALWGVAEDVPRILLSHNPDVAEDPEFVRTRPRVDLMLAGHTHGGQVWVPGLGTPVTPSLYGQKYASGLVQGPVCQVFVSRGIGTTILPMRFGVPPEIAVIEFSSA